MAHPYASQAKASQKRRLSALGAKAGKSFGSSSMYKKTSYPAKGAGTSRELTISGGTAKKRADRPANHFAGGGFVGGGMGGKKKSRKGHSTTNIVIASPGGGQAAAPPRPVPVPVPVNRPVPVPVGGGVPPVPPRPAGPPGAGGPPINVNVPPPAAAGPVGPPPGIRPPGLASGGTIKGSTYHNWGKGFANGGSVKKKASGGQVGGFRGRAPKQDDEDERPPINPMAFFGGGGGGGSAAASAPGVTDVGGGGGGGAPSGGGGGLTMMEPTPSFVAPLGQNFTESGGGGRMKKGGAVKKKAFGGPVAGGLGAAPAAPGRKPFAPAATPGQRPVVGRPGGPGVRGPGYKKGGKVAYHEDGDEVEPQASSTSVSGSPDTSGKSAMSGVMKALTGVNKAMSPTGAGSSSGVNAVKAAQGAQDAATKAGQAVAGSTQSLARSNQNAGFKPGAVPGAVGAGGKFSFNKGGSVKKVGAGTGLARLRDSKVAAKVPAKTEI